MPDTALGTAHGRSARGRVSDVNELGGRGLLCDGCGWTRRSWAVLSEQTGLAEAPAPTGISDATIGALMSALCVSGGEGLCSGCVLGGILTLPGRGLISSGTP